MLIGGGIGTALMYDGASTDLACKSAESSRQKIDELKKAYEAAKGRPSETTALATLERENKSAVLWVGSCEDAKEFYGTRTAIYGVIVVVGLLGVILGLALTIFARKKQTA